MALTSNDTKRSAPEAVVPDGPFAKKSRKNFKRAIVLSDDDSELEVKQSDLAGPFAKKTRKSFKRAIVLSDDDSEFEVKQPAPSAQDKILSPGSVVVVDGPDEKVDEQPDLDDDYVDSDEEDENDLPVEEGLDDLLALGDAAAAAIMADLPTPIAADLAVPATTSLVHSAPSFMDPIAWDNVWRFQALIQALIWVLHNWAHSPAYKTNADLPSAERAVSIGFANYFRRNSRETIFKAVLSIISDQVQSILGNPGLQALDLLQLPGIPRQGHYWGVYLDIATLLGRLPLKPEGLYAGSSLGLSYPGIRGRTNMHLRLSARDYDTLPVSSRSKHYSVICRADVVPNFRCVAKTDTEAGKDVVVVLLEGLMCVFLNTVKTVVGRRNPIASINIIKDMRRHANQIGHGLLPDFSHLSLNSASPLHQGWVDKTHPERRAHRRWATTHADVCGNPNCSRPRPERQSWRTWHGFKEDSRCPGCAKYVQTHGVEDPNPRRFRTEAEHQEWLKDPANKDVCGACGDPRPAGAVDWRGWCEQARCSRCRKPVPSKRTLTLREHKIWLEETGNPDVCWICKTKRPADYQAKSWSGYCEMSRCQRCYRKDREGQTQPRPKGYSASDHAKWLKTPGNHDVCGKCRAVRPEGSRKKGWRGYCELARCRVCCDNERKAAKEAAKAANS